MPSEPRLALYTFGVFAQPARGGANEGFFELEEQIFPLVDHAAGFISRSGYDGEPGPPEWGEQVFPRFYEEKGDGWSPATLSLWRDAEAAMAFSYHGLHAEALKRGREWMVRPSWPPYAAWWVGPDDAPSWADAVERHAHLHEQGPTPRAFDFKHPFDPGGAPTAIDRARVSNYAAQNARPSAAD